MATAPSSELIGANDAALDLGSAPAQSVVNLAQAPLATYAASYTQDAVSPKTPGEPDRLFLRLRNIRGNQGACTFDVAVSIPGAAAGPTRVGALALFGLENASDSRSGHGGGLTKTIEITEAVDPQLADLQRAGKIAVTLTPRGVLGKDDKITIGAIGLYRQAWR